MSEEMRFEEDEIGPTTFIGEGNKAPNPHGFHFAFINEHWKTK